MCRRWAARAAYGAHPQGTSSCRVGQTCAGAGGGLSHTQGHPRRFHVGYFRALSPAWGQNNILPRSDTESKETVASVAMGKETRIQPVNAIPPLPRGPLRDGTERRSPAGRGSAEQTVPGQQRPSAQLGLISSSGCGKTDSSPTGSTSNRPARVPDVTGGVGPLLLVFTLQRMTGHWETLRPKKPKLFRLRRGVVK